MPWLDWLAYKHPVIIHIPLAVAVMLPFAVATSQRAGRGIRPWWRVCRYLAWWAFLAVLPALLSGHVLAHKMNLLAPGQWLVRSVSSETYALRMHQMLALASAVLAVVVLRLFHRKRQDHQSLGFLALAAAFLLSAALVATAFYGMRLSRPVQVVVVREKAAPLPEPVPAPAIIPQSPSLIHRMLDFASLEPIQREPVKTTVHGSRWIRTWVTPAAAQAYREGQPLPPGTLVVLSSTEDRWGRPGTEPGPVYGMEIQPDGRPALAYYWGRVPEAKRDEAGGADRAEWRPGDARLDACMACHAQGMAPLKDRSTVYPYRKPKETTPGA